MPKITPCLWFDSKAEEAANFYVSTFSGRGRSASIRNVVRYGKEGYEIHGQKEDAVMTVDFELDGQPFTALNVVLCSSSMRPFHSKCSAIPRKTWIIFGRNFPPAAIQKRNNAAG